MAEEDSVKKIFGKTAQELIVESKEREEAQAKEEVKRAKRLEKEFFETHAGPEELKHLYWLLDQLSEEQLHKLATKCGVSSTYKDLDRETLSSWIEETNRETFYREYHKLVS